MNKVTLNNKGRIEFNSLLKTYLPMFSKYAMKTKPITIKELENNNSTKSSTKSNTAVNSLKSVKIEDKNDILTYSGYQQILSSTANLPDDLSNLPDLPDLSNLSDPDAD